MLIANTDIGLGHTVAASDLRWQTWPAAAAGASFVRKSERPDAIKELAGALTRASFSSGEPIREGKLIKGNGGGYMAAVLPSGMRAISTEISAETGAGGFILPNDHVDVILTRRDRLAEKSAGVEIHTSEIILPNVRVLAIDQTVEEKNGQRVAIGKTATLELSPPQAGSSRALPSARHDLARAAQPGRFRTQGQAGQPGRRWRQPPRRERGALRRHYHEHRQMKGR